MKYINSVFCLRRRDYPDLTVVQENRFNIGSESCYFCFWGEFLVIENSLYSIYSVYSEALSPFYIFLCIKQATKMFGLSPLMGFQLCCLVLFLLIIRSLDSNSSGIWCLKLSMELWLLVSLLITSAYSILISIWSFCVTMQ